MNKYHAAEHYASVLRNFAESVGYNPESVSVHSSDELSERYDDVPKVIWETGTFDIMGYEITTPYGFFALEDYGLDPEIAKKFNFSPYNGAVILVYDA